ncbi:hypothetical protein [Curtobacterium sp. MCJR17_043]|uniref:hypothetical protein n=1 Tax=Curtobacterium sp. MCJR17_043 TaxID=2175660 RepID=UPI0024DF557D|nr:hypothetical protein [Curtobacterium sp. MCJR17_043]WIB34728.1 hypothetical protein DEJ15_08790 [Curtobacterium sp. MCJR17_043]
MTDRPSAPRVDDGAGPGPEARDAPVVVVLVQRGRWHPVRPGREDLGGVRRHRPEATDEVGGDQLPAAVRAEQRRVPALAGEVLQRGDGLGAEGRPGQRRTGEQDRERLERPGLGGGDAVERPDGVEDGEHRVVGGGHPGQRTLHGDVHAVPTRDEQQVRTDDVALFVGADVLDEPCGGHRPSSTRRSRAGAGRRPTLAAVPAARRSRPRSSGRRDATGP